MWNKVVSLLACLCLFVAPLSVKAQTSTSTSGTFTLMSKGDIAPFDGLLLDPLATANILADKEYSTSEFELRLNFELNRQKADYELKLADLQLKLDTTTAIFDAISKIKDEQIKKTQEVALNQNDFTWLYVVGGVVGGVLLTSLAFGIANGFQR